MTCAHATLHQVSDATLRTTWELGEGGAYEPDAEYKVIWEETGTFDCADCGAVVTLDGDLRLA